MIHNFTWLDIKPVATTYTLLPLNLMEQKDAKNKKQTFLLFCQRWLVYSKKTSVRGCVLQVWCKTGVAWQVFMLNFSVMLKKQKKPNSCHLK